MAISAQEFVRALKASSDPPQPGGPTKLELAIHTWHDKSMLVPNKEENIVEWLLTRLLKDKDSNGYVNDPRSPLVPDTTFPSTSPSGPLLDLKVWKLLGDILEASTRSPNASRSSRPLRSWLLPLLNRLPISPILVTFLSLVTHEQSVELIDIACKTLALLWPLAVPKINADGLLDCFSALTSFLAHPDWKHFNGASAESFLHLANLVISSYRSSLSGHAAKKKVNRHMFPIRVSCTDAHIV